jgi:hypothetical protein
MHRYAVVSGAVFTLVSLGQLLRTILAWPANVNGFQIPVWFSGIAVIVTATMAVWAFRVARAGAGSQRPMA